MVLKYYQGAITISEMRSMPNRELMGYINAINNMEESSEDKPGLTGDAMIEQMKNDPAIKVV